MISNDFKLKTSNYIRVISNKKQIVLGNTYSYGLNHVKYSINRNGGSYNKIPHFTILKDGSIFQHFDTKFYSNYLDNEYSKDVITIGLENIGQIFMDNGEYVDIYNNRYIGEVVEQPWKNCSHWEPYTFEQLKSAIELCDKIIVDCNIQRNVMPTNVQKSDVFSFKGVCYKSNYDSKYYDLNPTWDFETFKEKIEKNG